MPASVAAGDLVVVFFGSDAAGSTVTIAGPAGWTELTEAADNVTESMISVAYRVCDGTAGATITVTTGASENAAAVAIRITGASPPSVSTAARGTSANPNPP